ncbi:MAG: tyrosine--tRNA ligase [Candidatus Paceibacterota bacterium]|jgi:tyrosyl-tRNA synthetase
MKKSVITDAKMVDDILNQGTEDIIIKEHLREALLSGKVLRVKFGIDPTGPKIHLGRAIPLRKLRQFQDLGHKVVLIVGDFTATIGDPSDKLEKRPMLSVSDIKKNMAGYKSQLGKIINLKKAEFVYNSKWLKKLNFKEIAELSESFSVQQMSNRRNFKDRLERDEEISLREFLYPLMQGYDSVAVRSDVEIGGFDQLFNLKAGRIVQKHYKMLEQDIMTVSMLEGTDGRKMSTSWGNVITIVDEPDDMFGKIMSVKDELIEKYFKLCTDTSLSSSEIINNPRDSKMKLAHEIVKIYHGEKKAKQTEDNFISTFQKKEIPDDTETIKPKASELLVDVFSRAGVIKSKSDFRRLVEEGAITHLDTKEKIVDQKQIAKSGVYKIGKHRFIKIL